MAEVFVGRNPGRSEYCKDGPRLLKVGDLSGQVTPWRDRKRNRVSQAWFEKNRRLALRSGDVCLTAAAHRPRYIGLKVDLVDAVPVEGAIPSGLKAHAESVAAFREYRRMEDEALETAVELFGPPTSRRDETRRVGTPLSVDCHLGDEHFTHWENTTLHSPGS